MDKSGRQVSWSAEDTRTCHALRHRHSTRATAYATFDGHRDDNYTPYVYATSDFGQTWRSIAADLPKGQVVRCITEDPKNANVLYLGTEFGLFVSLDKGGHWTRLRNGLPTVPVAEITIHPRDNDMLVATHGRSIWILDDITPIQQAAAALKKDAALFDVRPSMSFFDEPEDRSRWMGDRPFWGRNPRTRRRDLVLPSGPGQRCPPDRSATAAHRPSPTSTEDRWIERLASTASIGTFGIRRCRGPLFRASR